jgi:hypothetical protein
VRLSIFVSLALATTVASFAASACSRLDDYNHNMTAIQQKYQLAVDAANAGGTVSTVVFVYRGAREDVSGRCYDRTALSNMAGQYNLQNWQNWQKGVNAAVADYMTESQAAYYNYITTAC